jgi:IS5 family transposase
MNVGGSCSASPRGSHVRLFAEVQRYLAAKGLKIPPARSSMPRSSMLVDQDADKARDPEMHRTKKDSQWYFGMKAHFGITAAVS